MDHPGFVPEVDEHLVVQLPGERVRATVRAVPDDDSAIVELTIAPLNNKIHRYRKGDLVPCRRKTTPIEELWEAVDERQLAMAGALQRLKEADLYDPRPPKAEPPPPKENADAARTGKQPSNGVGKHPGNDPKRSPAKPGDSGKPGERKTAPASKRRYSTG